MDWIYYHEVISEFSLRHWAEVGVIDSFCKGPLAIRPQGAAAEDSAVGRMINHGRSKILANSGLDLKQHYMPYGCP